MSANQVLVIMMSHNKKIMLCLPLTSITSYWALNNLAQIIRFEVQTLTPLYFKVTSFLLFPFNFSYQLWNCSPFLASKQGELNVGG